MKPKIFFYVGKARWGKSSALFYIAEESNHRAWIKINNIDVFVRHTSNDDVPQSYFKFMESINPDCKPLIIAALCANFTDSWAKTENILDGLKKKGYDLFFWVMVHQWGTDDTIKTDEIARLRKYGKAEEYTKAREAKVRANSFGLYVRQIIRHS